MPYFADMVRDTAPACGTGSVTLNGTPPAPFRTFATAFAGQTVMTQIRIDDGTNYEVTFSVFDGTTGLTRGNFVSSSTGSRVNFASAVTVDCVTSAEFLDNGNKSAILMQMEGWVLP